MRRIDGKRIMAVLLCGTVAASTWGGAVQAEGLQMEPVQEIQIVASDTETVLKTAGEEILPEENQPGKDGADVSGGQIGEGGADITESQTGEGGADITESQTGEGGADITESQTGEGRADVSEGQTGEGGADMTESQTGDGSQDVVEGQNGNDSSDIQQELPENGGTNTPEEQEKEENRDVFETEALTETDSGDALLLEPNGIIVEAEEVSLEEVPALAAEAVMEGSCGKNGAAVNWKLENGVMTISGSGEMDDYRVVKDLYTGEIIEANYQPWLDQRSQITEVIVTEGVTSVGQNAFANCSQLKKVTIASSVKTIGSNAFVNCLGLEELNLGSGVESIYSDAFYGARITTLRLPKSIKNMDSASLLGLWYVERVEAEPGGVYSSVDGVLFRDGGKTLFYYPMNRGGSYTVPAGTTKIEEEAFTQSVITGVTIPDSVTEIGAFAFDSCEKLSAISFPSNLKVIDKYVCYGDTALTSVTIPEGVTEIRYGAFKCCSALATITIPASVVSIADAFSSNTQVILKNPGMYAQEDGTFVDAVKVNVTAREEYTKAFQVLELVNKERAKAGADPLVMDTSLLETAMQRGFETVLYWSHTRPTGSDCFTANSLMFGENIAMGQSSAASVMNSWMNSSGHKANILGTGYKSIGIGCVKFNGSYYWVQCFGAESVGTASASSCSDQDKTRQVAVKKDGEYYKASFKVSDTSLAVGETASVKTYWGGSELKNSGAVAESSNTAVCTVKNGTVTAVGAGTASITMYFPGYPEKAVVNKVTVTKSNTSSKTVKVTYNGNGGKASKKSKTVTKNKKYGTLATATRKGYTFLGWYTSKNGGKKITASSKATKKITLYAHWKKVSVGKASLQTVSSKKKATLTVKIKKLSGVKGYQIVCATDSKFKKNKKSVSVTGTSKTISGLKKGKTYYVRVRAFKKDSTGTKVYGGYSRTKKIKIKK